VYDRGEGGVGADCFEAKGICTEDRMEWSFVNRGISGIVLKREWCTKKRREKKGRDGK
jgi:hypothetical protein